MNFDSFENKLHEPLKAEKYINYSLFENIILNSNVLMRKKVQTSRNNSENLYF